MWAEIRPPDLTLSIPPFIIRGTYRVFPFALRKRPLFLFSQHITTHRDIGRGEKGKAARSAQILTHHDLALKRAALFLTYSFPFLFFWDFHLFPLSFLSVFTCYHSSLPPPPPESTGFLFVPSFPYPSMEPTSAFYAVREIRFVFLVVR